MNVNWKGFVASLIIVIIVVGWVLLYTRLKSLYKQYNIVSEGMRLNFENATISQEEFDEISSKDTVAIIGRVMAYGGLVLGVLFVIMLASVKED